MIEIFIAVFIHDSFIHPYFGDILVVVVVYCFVKSFIKGFEKYIPIGVFGFAVFVEILQYFNIVKLLHLENAKILKVVLGSVFDWSDVFCYFIGTLFILFYEKIKLYKKRETKERKEIK